MLKLVVLLAVLGLAFGAPSGKGADVGGKIVGGSTANIANFPWTIGLLSSNRLFCGAVLIGNGVALTAAHCLIPGSFTLTALSIRAGSSQWASGGQQVGLTRVVNHPSYSSNRHDFDISVMFLQTPVTSATARVIPLATTIPAAGAYATVTGWGALREGGAGSAVLQVVAVPVVSATSCRAIYGTTITNNMWCAGYAAGGRDACQGDSGGPAVVANQLAGLVSFGAGCARPNAPGVYASIPAFRTWIRTTSGV